MKRYDLPTEIIDVTIDHIDTKGQGVAFYTHPSRPGQDGKNLVLFISNVVPGDKVRVSVPNAKGRKRAYIREFELLEASSDRNLDNPLKPTIAGGTPLQYMTYKSQLKYKENLVKTYLETEHFNTSLMKPIIGMKEPNYYRNKMDFTFGPNGELGMHELGNFKNIIDLEDSVIAPQIMMEIKRTISDWQKQHELKGYNKENHRGLLRKVMLRQSATTNELMVVIYATQAPDYLENKINLLQQQLIEQYPDLVSLQWIVSNNISDQIVADERYLLAGREFINEKLNGFDYKIYYDTFFQASSEQAEQMVATAFDMVNVKSDMRVLDLFSGIGTFSLPFAKEVKEVVGIELIEQSILSAQENAEKANLQNTHFFVSDARKGLEQLKETWKTPDLLILNPPRSGAGGKLMRSIGRYGADNIIYISCNPKTLAEDLKWLKDFDYEFMSAQPIDQFPHTVHVETVVLMSKVNLPMG